MSTLPVFGTVRRSYSFVFHNLGLIYRLCWLPVLLAFLPGLLISIAFAPTPGAPGSPGSPLQVVGGVAIAVVIILLQCLFLSMALVALHRVLLFDDRKPGRFFVVSMGRAEIYFASIPIVLALAGIAATFVLAVAGGGGFFVAGGPEAGVRLAPFVAILAMWAVGIWLACRLVALYPLIVVTDRLSLRGAWRLSRRNAWRILGVFFFAALPLFLVQVVVGMVLLPVFAAIVQPMLARTLAEAGPEGLGTLVVVFSLVGTALYFVIVIPLIALGVAILCFTFKALARYAPDDVFLPPEG